MDTIKTYRYTVCDVEHPGDYERFASAIVDGGGIITSINWSGEDGDNAYIHFQCQPALLESIKQQLNKLL